jgi:hypothetical protein
MGEIKPQTYCRQKARFPTDQAHVMHHSSLSQSVDHYCPLCPAYQPRDSGCKEAIIGFWEPDGHSDSFTNEGANSQAHRLAGSCEVGGLLP